MGEISAIDGGVDRAPAGASGDRRFDLNRNSLSRLGFAGVGLRRLAPRRYLGMLVVATRLGSGRARAALSFILFLVIWLLLSVPDAFGATVTRSSSFTYDAASGLLLTETVEPGDA